MIVALKLRLALAAASLAMSLATPILITPRPDGRLVRSPSQTWSSFAHRAAGDFSRGDKPVKGSIVTVGIDRPPDHTEWRPDYGRDTETLNCLSGLEVDPLMLTARLCRSEHVRR